MDWKPIGVNCEWNPILNLKSKYRIEFLLGGLWGLFIGPSERVIEEYECKTIEDVGLDRNSEQ